MMMQPDDPPFLTVGTEVSAKYKGAFCEAKVNKVVKVVKIKVTFKQGLGGSAVLSDESIKGSFKVGAQVKALHPEKNQYFEAIINKIQDCSQYTVVFDDGDITTLRRTSLCLKSGRHFAESETLDQLPLTHPEHFGTPVVGGRRGRRSRPNLDSDASSEDEENVYKRHRLQREEWQSDIGKVVCVEIGDKKKQKDNWFPGLVVAPTAQDSVKIETKKDFLVRSFQDGRYYTVPKKETMNFNREVGQKVAQSVLRTAVDKALLYIDRDELPPHWDRDLLFGIDISDEDYEKDTDSDSSDDEPREEKDHFVAQLYKYMEECGAPINKAPTIGNKELDLYKLFKVVQKIGGFTRVMNQNQWKFVASKMNLQLGSQAGNLAKAAYKRYLQSFEDFYRKLGCTMVSNPRGSRTRHRSGRSLIRDCNRTPRQKQRDTESCESTEEEIEKKEEVEEVKEQSVKEEEASAPSELSEQGKDPIQLRRHTPPVVARTTSPIGKERLPPRESKVCKLEPKPNRSIRKDSYREEEVKTRSVTAATKEDEDENSRSTSEDEPEVISTRSLRNREEPKEKDDSSGGSKAATKRQRVIQEHHQRSTSCNSTSSGTSSSSSVSSSSGTSSSSSSGSSVVDSKFPDKATKPLSIEELKKRVHKKNFEAEIELPVGRSILPVHVPINIGDKLRVLYGPTNKESKVTYEAKVLEIDEEDGQKMYYVHYNGWNIRYDEWVFRQRIAQNLTWCQARAKKGRAAVTRELKEKEKNKDGFKSDKPEKDKESSCSTPSRAGMISKRSRSSSALEREDKDSDRSERSDLCSTPSVTRSSSRNETRDEKAIGTESNSDRRRSSRRTLELSKDFEDSFSEDFDSGAESNSENQKSKSDSLPPDSRCLISGSSGLSMELDESFKELQTVESNASHITCDSSGSKPSPAACLPSSCGKDIDMKAIESEMKGLDKPIKKEEGSGLKETAGRLLTTIIPGSLTVIEKKVHDPKKPFDSPVKKLEIPVKLVPALEVMGQIKPLPIIGLKKEPFFEEDIYEFKEPEPFDLGEMRSRKESKSSRGTGSNSGDDIEVEVKHKKHPKGWKEEKGTQEQFEVEDSDEATPKKDPPHVEAAESPANKVETWEMDIKSELREVPTKGEIKKEIRDYSRKVESKEILSLREDKKKEVAKRTHSNEGRTPSPSEIPEPFPQIEIREGQIASPSDLSKDLKSEINSEFPTDMKESVLFGASVILSPKKLSGRKDQVVLNTKSDPLGLKSLTTNGSNPLSKSGNTSELGNPVISKELTKMSSLAAKQKSASQTLERVLPAQVIPKLASQSGHILPQMIMPPVDSRALAKPIPKSVVEAKVEKSFVNTQVASSSKNDEREGKMMPFSQRQQHIFPHLLNRSEPPEEKNKPREIPAPKSPIPSTPIAQNIVVAHPPPEVLTPTKLSEGDKSKCETSVEESIEAVVMRARQDQVEGGTEMTPSDHKGLDKRRRNPIRSKKVLSREFLALTSEDSDSDTKSEKIEPFIRQKRSKGSGGLKSSPSKRNSRMASGADKKIVSICDEEERANDADEEDDEAGSAPLQSLCREALRRRREAEASNEGDDESDDKEKQTPKKKRRSSASIRRSDDSEETGLGDLLCKETIPPGSPMPQESLDPEISVDPADVKQEMPFASVPTGSSFSKRTTPPVSSQIILQSHSTLPPPPPLQLPPSICIQPVPQGRTHFETNVSQVSPPTVTITSIPLGSRLPPISNADKIAPPSNSFEKSICAKVTNPESSNGKNTSHTCETPDGEGATVNSRINSPSIPPQSDQSLPMERNSLSTLIKASLSESASSAVKIRIEDVRAHPPLPPVIPAIDNTPPTTPESVVSNFSDSPRREAEATKMYDTSKSGHSCSSELDYDNKMENFSEDSNTMDSSSSATKPRRTGTSAALNPGGLGGSGIHSHSEGWDTEDGTGSCHAHSKKRKKEGPKVRIHEDDEEDDSHKATSSAILCLSRRRCRHSSRSSGKGEEDLDNHGLNALSLAACASGRSRFNFCQELDPELDATKRISILQTRMQELKRTYMQVKAELASVERRRKRLKKKENE